MFRDIIPFWGEWVVCAILLSVHLLVQFHLPVAGISGKQTHLLFAASHLTSSCIPPTLVHPTL
jgi:hypothetical protein